MPREISVVSPRSACPKCEKPIAAYDNIPVLSWVFLGGKCRNCKAPISGRYALVELLTGALFALSYMAAAGMLPGFLREIIAGCAPLGGTITVALKYCVFSFLLLGLIFTDAETQLLPDLLTKPGIGLGLAFSLLVPLDGPAQYVLPALDNCPIVSLLNSLAGACLGAAFILGIALLYEAIRKVEGMGRGDVKLMGLIGAFIGVKLTLLVLLLASLIGSLFGLFLIVAVWLKRLARRRRRHASEPSAVARQKAWKSAMMIYRNFPIAFGVFLGAAALFSAFWGAGLFRWYVGFYR